jgi:lipid II:glycine glycyltransferase (peptidoglycan interpeptide bridge formation enzyme)
MFTAYLEEDAIASALVFACNEKTALVFYWAHLEEYKNFRPVNILVDAIIQWARENGFHYLDYGTQTYRMQYTHSHIAFKESMGAKPIFRTTYEIQL